MLNEDWNPFNESLYFRVNYPIKKLKTNII